MTSVLSAAIRELGLTAQAAMPYVDQPHVVRALQRASWPVGTAGGIMMATKAVQQQPTPQAKRKETLQQGLVLGATLAGTYLGARRWFYHAPEVAHALSPDALKQLGHTYGPQVAQLAAKTRKSLSDFKTLLKQVTNGPGVSPAQRLKDLAHVMPAPALEDEGFSEVTNFLKLGTASVGGGLLGGLIANKLNNVPKGSNLSMVKEGVFQLLVNIGLCGAGAAAGIIGARAFKQDANRLGRFLWVSGGLTAGIAAGNSVSNLLHKHILQPVSNYLSASSEEADTASTPLSALPRQVGWQDLMMHVDDLPLMLMFAGVEATKPVIPLCFAYSGYRSGIAEEPSPTAKASIAAQRFATGQLPANAVFRPFHANQALS